MNRKTRKELTSKQRTVLHRLKFGDSLTRWTSSRYTFAGSQIGTDDRSVHSSVVSALVKKGLVREFEVQTRPSYFIYYPTKLGKKTVTWRESL